MRKAVAFLVAVGLPGCVGEDAYPVRPPSTVTFEAADAVLYVYVADDAEEQRRGLMEVEHLPGDQGMAFVFDDPVSTSFWMKDTLIPLSIAFVDERGEVIGIREMEPCEEDPCPIYAVDRPFVLAIEANRGWFAQAGVDIGDRATLRVMSYG